MVHELTAHPDGMWDVASGATPEVTRVRESEFMHVVVYGISFETALKKP